MLYGQEWGIENVEITTEKNHSFVDRNGLNEHLLHQSISFLSAERLRGFFADEPQGPKEYSIAPMKCLDNFQFTAKDPRNPKHLRSQVATSLSALPSDVSEARGAQSHCLQHPQQCSAMAVSHESSDPFAARHFYFQCSHESLRKEGSLVTYYRSVSWWSSSSLVVFNGSYIGGPCFGCSIPYRFACSLATHFGLSFCKPIVVQVQMDATSISRSPCHQLQHRNDFQQLVAGPAALPKRSANAAVAGCHQLQCGHQ